MWNPGSSQQAQQFNSPPIRKYEIRLDGVDRSQGQFLPSFEGGSRSRVPFTARSTFSRIMRQTPPGRSGDI